MSHVVILRLIPSTLAIGLGFALLATVPAQAAESAVGVIATAPENRCQVIFSQKQRLNEDIASQDAELTVRLGQMNSAPTEQKATLVAAIVTTLVEQRVIRDVRRAKIQDDMMAHMMDHPGQAGMAGCPMMQGGNGPEGKRPGGWRKDGPQVDDKGRKPADDKALKPADDNVIKPRENMKDPLPADGNAGRALPKL